MTQWRSIERLQAIRNLIKWLAIGLTIGILTGTSSAALKATLDVATVWRESHRWIIWLLPLGGLLSGLIYDYVGKSVAAGNNLIIAEIHQPQALVPLRMAPLIFIGTAIAHFFGASVGREGTAVQMGAALADRLTPLLKLTDPERRIVLMAGISSGVASVFGTPLAGTIFGLEVLTVGSLRYDGLLTCAIAAIVGHNVSLAWGLSNQAYNIPIVPQWTLWGLIAAIIAGSIFGLSARIFAALTRKIGAYFQAKINYPPLRPCIGGIFIAIAVLVFDTKYIGLGIPTIVSAFQTQLPPGDFAAKIGFTALSLGSGFKGGEVTPLFYIGATLGNALSPILALPAPLLAGMGFVAVFAGAANTPIASTLMAIELFGSPAGSYAAIACIVSCLCSGRVGIYRAQYIGLSKYALFFPPRATINQPSIADPPQDPTEI